MPLSVFAALRETPVSRRAFLALGAAAFACGCGKRFSASNTLTWGRQGRRDGEFIQPRGIGVNNHEVYVVDTTGRIQVLDFEGQFVRKWRTPDAVNGTPTNIGFAPDGVVLVPDTHYSRILEYSPQGDLLRQWGEYGNGPEQFIYPTGIVQIEDGTCFVSEYGAGAERVHVFDADRNFVRQWGRHGEGAEQFNRIMGIALDPQGNIVVADTANHRAKCYTPEGELVRIVSEAGTAEGQLKFPYDVSIADDGSVILCEYGNHRISRFTSDGEFVACYGAPGREPGQFNAPRGAAFGGQSYIFVADTDNHRIQRLEV